jgi:putative addiction module killer protein
MITDSEPIYKRKPLLHVGQGPAAGHQIVQPGSGPRGLSRLDIGNFYVTIKPVLEVREYNTEDARIPFRKWFDRLNSAAAIKVTTALERMADGNLSNAKSVGGGVSEYRIDFGPGYRIYFGRDGETLVILLCGGAKKRQQADIEDAKKLWADYKVRKKAENRRRNRDATDN